VSPAPEAPESSANIPEVEYVDRRWTIPKKIWDQILEMAANSGINYAELVCMLLEDGIKVAMRLPVEHARPAPAPPPWTAVRIEGPKDQLVAQVNMRQVPDTDEIVTIKGTHYVVRQRAWAVAGDGLVGFLRVEEFQTS
jgi:hypothetical protein